MNERTSALRDRARRSHRVGDPEQEALGRESRALTEGEPDVIRNAKAFAPYDQKQRAELVRRASARRRPFGA